MSRSEKSAGKKSMAFGVDTQMTPGTPRTFVQVWDTSKDERPCSEGDEGFNNILANEWDVSEERVLFLAREHKIPLAQTEVFVVFD